VLLAALPCPQAATQNDSCPREAYSLQSHQYRSLAIGTSVTTFSGSPFLLTLTIVDCGELLELAGFPLLWEMTRGSIVLKSHPREPCRLALLVAGRCPELVRSCLMSPSLRLDQVIDAWLETLMNHQRLAQSTRGIGSRLVLSSAWNCDGPARGSEVSYALVHREQQYLNFL
jgi:hypothetical protein